MIEERRATLPALMALLLSAALQAQPISGGLQTAWVRHYTAGLAPSRGEAAAVATDHDGNVYVTGWSHAGLDGSDFLTIKYDATGNELWSQRYNREAGSEDAAIRIAVHPDGGVVVCGTSNAEVVTIRYGEDGVVQWLQIHQSSWWSNSVVALTVDDTGNVFVLMSRLEGLVKYGPSGQLLLPAPSGAGTSAVLTSLSNSAPSQSTRAMPPSYYSVGMGMDDSGYVYILRGMSYWGWTNGYVDKLDGDGNVVWEIGQPGSSSAIAVDPLGNVYVAGDDGNTDYWYDEFSPMFSLTKYDATGSMVWRHLDSTSGNTGWVSSLSLDSTGHLFLLGSASAVCYDTSGKRLWFVRGGSQMTVDSKGNMIVADTSGGGVMFSRYSLSLDAVWTRYAATSGDTVETIRSLAMDGGGNIYVAGKAAGNYATVGYHPSSGAEWKRSVVYRAPGNANEWLSDMALDGRGNIILGATAGQYPNDGFLTVGFSPAGDTIWTRTVAVPESSWCNVVLLVIDEDDNTIVLGSRYENGATQMLLFKQSPQGNLLWSVEIEHPDSTIDTPTSLAVDRSGNIFVAGSRALINPPTWPNGALSIMKFTPDGLLAWSRAYGKGAADDIVVDRDGSAIVLGKSFDTSTRPDLLIKYDSAGTVLWTKLETGYVYGRRRIAIDANGNIYATRTSTATDVTQNHPFVTTKYSPSGATLWSREFKYYAIGNGQDGPADLAVDDSGSVYVTGTSSIDTWMDCITIKYAADGQPVWVRRFGESNGVHDQPSSIALDSKGTVYVTGTMTLSYSRDGVEQVIGGDGLKVLVDRDDNVYVGRTTSGSNGSALTVTKYSPIATSVHDGSPNLPEGFALEQNFPNPFNPTTEIRFRITERRLVRLTVYDMLGREVGTLVNEELTAGQHTVRWNAAHLSSGIYLYRLQAGKETGWRRMVLIR